MYLNKRIEEILKMLIDKDYLSIEEISKKLNISRRTTYYSMEKVEYYLTMNSIKLHKQRSLGYYLTVSDKEKISKILSYSNEDYILSPNERYIKIIIYMLTYKEKLTIEKLCDLLQVSRNTILNDIKYSKEYVNKYKLKIESTYGYEVKGIEKDKRYLLLNLFNNYEYLFNHCEFLEEYTYIKNCTCKENDNISNLRYIDYSLKYLTFMYKYFYKAKDSLNYDEFDINYLNSIDSSDIAKSILKILSETINITIDENEKYYIQTFITTDKEIRNLVSMQNIEDKYLYEINRMVKDFEKISCIGIDNYYELSLNILNHLTPSLFRLKYGVYYPNDIKDEVKTKYKSIFQFTKQVVKNIENLLGCIFNDDELAYIAMYFGGYAVKMGVEIKIPKIVIVCNHGMATSQLLKIQVEELFDLIEINDVLSLSNFYKYEKPYDFAITTVDIPNCKDNIIKVNPVLNDFDKQNLISQISSTQSNFNINKELVQKIMNSIDRYATITNRDKLREEIENIVLSNREKNEVNKTYLSDLLSVDTISLNQEATNWKEAIEISSSILLSLGYIEKPYIQAMIKNIEELGPYIIISENVALPHAKPENGVNKIGISITTFKNEVCFSENKKHKAKIFIVLAPKDKYSHLNALVSINKMLSDKDNLEKILNANSKSEIIKIINKYS